MLRIGREVAWLSEGSCTDQVISAADATPDSAIRPTPLTTYALADVADAHRALESGDNLGKIVLVVSG